MCPPLHSHIRMTYHARIMPCDGMQAESMPLHLPGDLEGQPLPLFAARTITQAQQLRGGGGGRAAGPATTSYMLDGIAYAGGLVWALDWCPPPSPAASQEAAASETALLALSVHPRGHTRTAAGRSHSGRGAVQLWCVPRSSEAPGCPQGLPAPLVSVLHEGLVAWDVKWCPHAGGLVQGLGEVAAQGGRWAL